MSTKLYKYILGVSLYVIKLSGINDHENHGFLFDKTECMKNHENYVGDLKLSSMPSQYKNLKINFMLHENDMQSRN